MLPTSASFLVTENCNLACKYCFEKHNTNIMSQEVVDRGLEYLCQNAIDERTGEFSALIFGGEPLLNPEMMDAIFHKGQDLAEKTGMRFSASIVTNATIMDDKIYDILKWHRDLSNISIQLSIDGMEESQNLYRVTRDGKGSFEKVERNIERFKQIFEGQLHRLCVHSCVNKQTLPKMYDNYKFFRDTWGIENIWFLPVAEEDWSDDDVKLYEIQMGKITNDIENILRTSRDPKIIEQFAPLDRCMNSRWASKPCGAGDSFVTITANGDVFPCHQVYFNDNEKKYKLGNVLEDVFYEEVRKPFIEYTRSALSCPENCECVNCYRCIAANYCHTGDFFDQIRGNYCKLMHVDKGCQDRLRSVIKELDLMPMYDDENCQCCAEETVQGECLCNAREGNSVNNCDIVHRQSVCESGNNCDNPNCMCDARSSSGMVTTQNYEENEEAEFRETMTLAMQVILAELSDIKEMVKKLEHSRSEK